MLQISDRTCWRFSRDLSCRSGTFLAGDGLSSSLVLVLNKRATEEEIVEDIIGLENGWSLVYYRSDLDRVFIGRDVFGRYSLVWTVDQDSLLISALVQPEIQSIWNDVPYGQITAIDRKTREARMYSFLGEYPDSADSIWREHFAKTDFVWRREKMELLTISRQLTTATEDSPKELESRLVRISAQLLNKGSNEVMVAFSGGVDSLLIALALIRAAPSSMTIRLVNVAFGKNEKAFDEAPDRTRALAAWPFLKATDSHSRLRLILVNVRPEELELNRKRFIYRAATPARSVLDDSLACVLWFALRAEGTDLETGRQSAYSGEQAFVGSGADELFAGYARHRTRYEKEGVDAAITECESELRRLGLRNGGRDARVAKIVGRTLIAPFLVDELVEWANRLPMTMKCDLSLPRGQGEKKIIRDCLKQLGAPHAAPKQAMQFGSRMAKMSNASKEVKGSDLSEHLVL